MLIGVFNINIQKLRAILTPILRKNFNKQCIKNLIFRTTMTITVTLKYQ